MAATLFYKTSYAAGVVDQSGKFHTVTFTVAQHLHYRHSVVWQSNAYQFMSYATHRKQFFSEPFSVTFSTHLLRALCFIAKPLRAASNRVHYIFMIMMSLTGQRTQLQQDPSSSHQRKDGYTNTEG